MKSDAERYAVLKVVNGVFNPVVVVKEPLDVGILDLRAYIGKHQKKKQVCDLHFAMQLAQRLSLRVLGQMCDRNKLVRYVLAVNQQQRHVLLPCVNSTPDPKQALISHVDPAVTQSLAAYKDVCEIAAHYYGDVRTEICVDNLAVAFVKHHLIFYHAATAESTSAATANARRVHFRYNPLDVNISIYNKTAFDLSHYAHALKSVYTNYLFTVLQLLHAKYNRDWHTRIEVVDYEVIQKNIEATLKSQAKASLSEQSVLYACEDDPSQFFCKGDKVLVAAEFKYLVEAIHGFVERGEYNPVQFANGLFVMIGKFQFKRLTGEHVIVKSLSGK